MTDNLTRVPPSSIPAEACVLGSMLLNPDSLAEAVADVRPEWFYRPAHATIFNELVLLSEQGKAADLVVLRDSLGDRLESVDGIEYLASLVEGVPNAASIAHYAEIIRNKHTKRQLILAGTSIVDMAYNDSVSAVDAVGETYSIVQSAGQQQRARHQVSAGAAMGHLIEQTEAIRSGQVSPSLPSGFAVLDALLAGNGFRPGDLVLIAGRPSTGKSLVAGDIARRIVLSKRGVLFVSAEMPAQSLMERQAAAITGILTSKISNANLSPDDIEELKLVKKEMDTWQFEIIDRSATIPEVAAEAKRLNNRWNGNLACVIVDYLQLMIPDSRAASREQAVGGMCRQCKVYAQQMEVPWIVLSQFNRAGAEGRPSLHQLRDSGQLEEHANTVILLDYNDDKEYDAPWSEGGKFKHMLLNLAKQRAGPVTCWRTAISRKLRGYVTRTETLTGDELEMETDNEKESA